MNQSNALPIDDCLAEIVDAVQGDVPVVLKAPPGAGKTTGVPPALLRARIADQGQIILVQPRRLAARTAADRISRLTGVRLGEKVGYHIRFDRKTSASTEVIVMTTGILLRRLGSDPLLDGVACVILDEFHERSIEMDLALGMIHRIRQTLRPDLKLIVMSATLDPLPIVDFLGDAKPVSSEGRAFPVEVRYTQDLSSDRLENQVADALPEVLSATEGHVLVFLPGVGEIRRAMSTIIERGLNRNVNVLPLYGDLSIKEQNRVLDDESCRKIILSTNVAETSITIPGVTGVIDSGKARVLRFQPSVGMSALRIEPISQASAEQRAGRAGRTSPGVCLRLWPAKTHRSRRETDMPEITRTDFCGAMLMLAAWGERDPNLFPWLTPPSQESINTATELLVRIGAIDDQGGLTKDGTRMLSLPLHPRLARFMVSAANSGVAERAALAAALLTERDPFRRSRKTRYTRTQSDVVDRVERMEAFSSGDTQDIEIGSAKHVNRVAKQLLKAASSMDTGNDTIKTPTDERLMRALLAAYPDRVAKRRVAQSDAAGTSLTNRALMVGGRGVKLDERSVVNESDLFLCIDVDAKGVEAHVRVASAINEDWLPDRLSREVDEPFFDSKLQTVVARRRRYFLDLQLDELPIPVQAQPCRRQNVVRCDARGYWSLVS